MTAASITNEIRLEFCFILVLSSVAQQNIGLAFGTLKRLKGGGGVVWYHHWRWDDDGLFVKEDQQHFSHNG